MWFDLRLSVADGAGPVFLRIAEAVAAEIRRGRLRPGDRLPGTRTLARQLGVHRNTVTAAWGELRAQGWIAVHPRGRTEVAPLPPLPARVERGARPAGPPFRLDPEPGPALAPDWPPGTLVLAGGQPDLRHLPVDALGRAWRAVVRRSRERVLDYVAPEGHPRLRAAIAAMLAQERGLSVGPDEVVVTRGSQQALYLVAQALVRPGDRVAVERLGYPPAWAALRAAGAQLVPIDVDAEGLRVDQVADAAVEGLRAVYCTPHHQYPTMATLTAGRRLLLGALARQHGFAVIEDDYDNEFHFRGRPVLPLAAHDPDGAVIYVGTFSKTLAPGLRLGFLAAHRAVVRAVVARRVAVDRQGDAATELAIAMLIEDGTVPRHLRRMRRIYAARQAAVAAALQAGLGDRVSFEVPAGGLALWVRSAIEVEGWQARAAKRGVGFDVARRYHLDGAALPFLRVGFASLDEGQLARAVDGLVAAQAP